ncbi:MAG: hypothetical protein FWH10_03730 [Oscillospiraceae bacterium]|nr:hypothetical protein [Oscillospiraceae bacterium]
MTANGNRNIKTGVKKRENKTKPRSRIFRAGAVFAMTLFSVFLSVSVSVFPGVQPGLNLTVLFFSSAAAAALLACVVFITGPAIIIPAGALSFAASLALGGGIIKSIVCTGYIFAAAFIYFGIKNIKGAKSKRTRITVSAAACLSVFYAFVILIHIFLSAGALSADLIASASEAELRRRVEGYIIMSGREAGDYTAETESLITELVVNFQAILPAMFIIYNLASAYLATSLFKYAYNFFAPRTANNINNNKKKIKSVAWRINMSVISAVIMLTSIFAAILFSSSGNILASIVLTNLIYILIPGFLVTGFYFICDRYFSHDRNIKIFLIPAAAAGAALIVSVYFGAVLITAAATLTGLYAALIGDIKKFYEKTRKWLFGEDDDFDYFE